MVLSTDKKSVYSWGVNDEGELVFIFFIFLIIQARDGEETIPDLIKKGVLVQKEVKDVKDKKRNNESQSELTVEKKLDILATVVNMLFDQVTKLQQDFYGE